MIHVGVGVDFSLVYGVLKYLLDELERDHHRAQVKSNEDDLQNEVLECNMHTALYLLIIMCKVFAIFFQKLWGITASYQNFFYEPPIPCNILNDCST